MSAKSFKTVIAVMVGAGLVLSTATARPQDAAATPVVKLSYGVSEIIKLHQAKIGDDTIVAYISNAGTGYALDADQIIYLRQQGLSGEVITAMLNQGRPGTVATAPAPQPASPVATATAPSAPATTGYTAQASAPSVSYVQTAPVTTYYSTPATYYYQPYYYPAYAYPPVSIGIGWGWGWGWRGGGWHGGWHR